MVAERLNGLLRKVVGLDHLSGFRIGSSDLIISHLQYVDDTIMISSELMENIWIIKAIIRGFDQLLAFGSISPKVSLMVLMWDILF